MDTLDGSPSAYILINYWLPVTHYIQNQYTIVHQNYIGSVLVIRNVNQEIDGHKLLSNLNSQN